MHKLGGNEVAALIRAGKREAVSGHVRYLLLGASEGVVARELQIERLPDILSFELQLNDVVVDAHSAFAERVRSDGSSVDAAAKPRSEPVLIGAEQGYILEADELIVEQHHRPEVVAVGRRRIHERTAARAQVDIDGVRGVGISGSSKVEAVMPDCASCRECFG
jgi:hypothetical protein